MSVIVMGMEMPENCYECRFQSELRLYCNAMPDNFCGNTDDIERPDWCPLVEIPTPHGRLIDAAFEEQHYTSMTTNPTPDVTEQDKHNSLVIVRALQMAKTIIEAEGTE